MIPRFENTYRCNNHDDYYEQKTSKQLESKVWTWSAAFLELSLIKFPRFIFDKVRVKQPIKEVSKFAFVDKSRVVFVYFSEERFESLALDLHEALSDDFADFEVTFPFVFEHLKKKIFDLAGVKSSFPIDIVVLKVFVNVPL